jgi:phosphoglycerate kinase
MKIKSIKKANIKNKRVLVRVDFNVPLDKDKVSDDTRIRAALPTIKYLIKNDAKVILMSHLGRPEGKKVESLKLDPIAKELSKILKKPVRKLDDCCGDKVKKEIDKMKPKEVVLLENTRFHKEEENCGTEFSKKLAALGDIFVTDSFGTVHRKHASTYGVAKHLPSYAGLLLEKEINALSALMKDVPNPFTIIMGGAKIDTKIGLMQNFLGKADNFIVGGALANTFLAASGFDVAKSLYESDKIELAQEIMLEAETLKTTFYLPDDVVVADEITDDAQTIDIPVRDVIGNMKILDIGRNTIKTFEDVIKKSKTIIWNGPVGLYEKEPFSRGTRHIAVAVAKAKAKTIIGGGDTIDAINHFGIELDKYDHVSTGGGAMLEFLEGTKLPGIEIVME